MEYTYYKKKIYATNGGMKIYSSLILLTIQLLS